MAGDDDIRQNAGKPGAGPGARMMNRELAAMGTKRYGLAVVVLLITALALVAPAAATDWPVTTATDIAATISGAGNDDTITLSPGTYTWHDLSIAGKSLTFRADASLGGDRMNTIIDARNSNRIFSVTDGSSLTIEGLTLRNGKAPVGVTGRVREGNNLPEPGGVGANGGAISSAGPVTITSSAIVGCSAGDGGGGGDSSMSGQPGGNGGNGGAIYTTGTVTVTTSTIAGCSAGDGGHGGSGSTGSGGAHGGAGGSGGAISAATVTVTSSTISGCMAGKGGGGGTTWFDSGDPGNSYGGSGGSGGALAAATVTVTSSTISGCTAGNGGNGGTDDTGITRAHGGSGGSGGALSAVTVTVTSSTISGCTTGKGGKGYDSDGAAGNGGAVYAGSSGTIHFCRLVDNDVGTAVYGPVDAANNWWGTGSPAGKTGNGASASTWLVPGATAVPATITAAQTATIQANLTYNSTGMDTSGDGHVPDGIPVTFAAPGGSISPATAATNAGVAYATFTPALQGTETFTVTIDDQSVTVPVTVTEPGVTATTIVIDPAAPATLYAGLDNEGIYRSTDSGAAWTAATTQPVDKRIRALVIRPGDRTKLFAGTYGGGVYNSTDSGITWTACPNSGLANLNVVSLVTDSSGKLYAGTEAGVFSSTDNCATWTEMNGGLP